MFSSAFRLAFCAAAFCTFADILAAQAAFAPNNWGNWTLKNYDNRLTFETNVVAGCSRCLVLHGSTNAGDTAWSAVSGKMVIPLDAREFLLSVDVKSPKLIRDHGKNGDGWNTAITWFDADCKKIAAQPIPRFVIPGDRRFHTVREWGEIPANAAACTVRLGFDEPNIGPGEEIHLCNFSFDMFTAAQSRKAEFEERQRGKEWIVDILYPKATNQPQRVTLRDDGMTLIDGQPFFPIGMYAVCRREFNGNDLDKAFAGLKDAGFNFAHTYDNSYDPEFLAAARKYGFKLWVQARMPDRKLLDIGRHNPSIIAWYLGDDTLEHQSVQEVSDNNAAVKAVDPYRITCQADPIGSERKVSRYAAYVRCTDVFMPEIYPVRNDVGDKTDSTCVAETVRDMKRVADDVRTFGNGHPYGCWPIIQYFKGWGGWGHFPTRDQLLAMTWAAVIHGAHGITWYTYGGFYSKKRKKYNEGVTSTPERWQTISELATKLHELTPVLVERTPREQPKVEIVSGPEKDPLGENPSVTVLLKRHAGKDYLFMVNASTESVKVKVTMPSGGVTKWELPPFGVKIP